MFIFGHIGITIGLLVLIIYVSKKRELFQQIDFRLVIIFALLPDIIDKIVGHFILHDTLNNGRLFSHTLLFWCIFSMIFLIIVKNKWWIYSFSVGCHQIFDTMWEDPKTWLWPIYGWEFEYLDIDVWDRWLTALVSDPFISITETIGIIILIIIIIQFKLFKMENLKTFFKTGRMQLK